MTRPTTTPDTAKSQLDKFKDLARELDADDSEEWFDERLRKIAKSPPPEKGGKQS